MIISAGADDIVGEPAADSNYGAGEKVWSVGGKIDAAKIDMEVLGFIPDN
jgi:hypothetical protein